MFQLHLCYLYDSEQIFIPNLATRSESKGYISYILSIIWSNADGRVGGNLAYITLMEANPVGDKCLVRVQLYVTVTVTPVVSLIIAPKTCTQSKLCR